MSFELKSIPGERFSITPKLTGDLIKFLNKDLSLSGSGLSGKKKLQFYTELSVLTGSGVDLKTALDLIKEEEKKNNLNELFNRILQKVVSGKSLSESLGEEKGFTPYEVQSIRIGEQTARTSFIYEELAAYFDRSIRFRRQAISAITYPAIMIGASAVVLLFMLSFVVPMLEDILARFGGKLPFITQVVVSASDFLLNNGIYIFLGLLAIVGVFFIFSQKPWYKRLSAFILLRIPVIGEFIKRIYSARFCHVMHLLLSSKTPLVEALSLTKEMIGFHPFKESIQIILENVIRGQSLNLSMSAHNIFSSRIVALVRVAEEVNQMDLIFKKIGDGLSAEIEHQSSVIKQLLEPLVILFVGATIGFILIAMYLPLFELSTTINPY